MSKVTTLRDLQEKVKAFCEARDWDQFHGAKDLAIGLVTESAELLEIFRFKDAQETELLLQNKIKREAIGEELADALFFILRIAQKYGFDLTSEFEKKLTKNEDKYPKELSRGSNKKYSEL